VCAIGSVGLKRGISMEALDPHDYDKIAATFGIAAALVQEIEWMNDEGAYYSTPKDRWQRMRAWVASQIKDIPAHE